MGVGGLGMLATANYVARRYGVRSAMYVASSLRAESCMKLPSSSQAMLSTGRADHWEVHVSTGLCFLNSLNLIMTLLWSPRPGFIARRLCPELVFVKPDFSKYSRAGQAVRAIFREFDADMESGSLDEAYLDITDYCQQHGMTGETPGSLGDLRNLLVAKASRFRAEVSSLGTSFWQQVYGGKDAQVGCVAHQTLHT